MDTAIWWRIWRTVFDDCMAGAHVFSVHVDDEPVQPGATHAVEIWTNLCDRIKVKQCCFYHTDHKDCVTAIGFCTVGQVRNGRSDTCLQTRAEIHIFPVEHHL